MNNLEVLIFGLLFAGTAGAAFAFMWRSMGMVREEYNRPKRRIHPEMEDVKSGESLLVFSAEEKEEKEEDDDGDIFVVRK